MQAEKKEILPASPVDVVRRFLEDKDPKIAWVVKQCGLPPTRKNYFYAFLDARKYPNVRLTAKTVASIATFFGIDPDVAYDDYLARAGRKPEPER